MNPPAELARIIHDGSLRSTHCNRRAMGPRQSRRETGGWSREGGRRTGDPLLCRVQRVISTSTD